MIKQSFHKVSFIGIIFLSIVTTGCAAQPPASYISDPDLIQSIATLFTAGAAVFTAIFISGVGMVIGMAYRRRELEITRAETVRKFFEILLSTEKDDKDENQVQAALFTISTLNPKFAIQLAELLATQKAGAIYALDRFASNSDRQVAKLAQSALNNIMDKPHVWKNTTDGVLNKARAYILIDDMVKGRRYYSDAQICDIFELACKSEKGKPDPEVGNELGSWLDMHRMAAIYRLLNLFPKSNGYHVNLINLILPHPNEGNIRRVFERMIPLFRAIIDVNSKSLYVHEDYAHLAYVYKDSPEPQWEKAKEYIGEAIRKLPETHKGMSNEKRERFLVAYHFNKLLCEINLSLPARDDKRCCSAMEAYAMLGKEYKKEMIVTHPILKPGMDRLRRESTSMSLSNKELKKWEVELKL